MYALKTRGSLGYNHPALWISLPLAAGIATASWGDVFGNLGFWPLLLCAILAAMGAWAVDTFRDGLRRDRPAWFGLFVILSFFFLGAALFIDSMAAVRVGWPEGTRTTAHAVILDKPKEGSRSMGMTVGLSDDRHRTLRVRLTLPTADDPRVSDLHVGDALRFQTYIHAPHNFSDSLSFDYATYLLRRGISGQAYCPAARWEKLPESRAEELRSALPPLARLRLKALMARDKLVGLYVRHVSSEGLGVVSAMTLGDTSEIDGTTRSVYAQTGTSHVLALSGLHLSILFGLVKFLLLDRCTRRAVRVVACLAAIFGLWAFALLAGLPVSLVRATTMYTILVLSNLCQRDNSSLNSLATAAFFILLFSPMSLFDVGFQLSFLSVAAILLPLPLLTPEKSTRISRWFTSFVTLPVCAQIAVVPLVALYFHTLPLYFLPANLVAVPVSTIILTTALVFFLVPVDAVQALLGTLLGWLAEGMNHALGVIATWPGAYVEYHPSTVGVALAYVALITATALLATRKRSLVYALVGIITLTVCTELLAHSPASINLS